MNLSKLLVEENGLSCGKTPSYFFDLDEFERNVKEVKSCLGDEIPLTFSVKANPFLLYKIPEQIAHVEVCSPGELEICKNMHIDPEKIIYSGVMKEYEDIKAAAEYKVGIMTAESLLHAELEQSILEEIENKTGERIIQKVILRLTSGNQFGMSKENIKYLITHEDMYKKLDFCGIHYYSGTQKKKIKTIEKDIAELSALLTELKSECGFEPELVEYGPGAFVDYFEPEYESSDIEYLSQLCEVIRPFADKVKLGIEMGRFLSSSCGSYVTEVKDVKNNNGVNYIIVDGGIHHLKYYGQMMAMQVPPVSVIHEENGSCSTSQMDKETDHVHYCICGSLCTTADVLVRDIELRELSVGDCIVFEKCGAYSVTEGSALFLSRNLPEVYMIHDRKVIKVRDALHTSQINSACFHACSD